LGPAEIHERYTERVDEPRTKRTIRTYLSKMTQYNLLEGRRNESGSKIHAHHKRDLTVD